MNTAQFPYVVDTHVVRNVRSVVIRNKRNCIAEEEMGEVLAQTGD